MTFYSTFSDTSSDIELSWIVTLASGTRYIYSSPNEAEGIRQLGIVLNDPENSLTIPARMDMNNTMVVRHAADTADTFGSAFSYQGNLKVLGQCVCDCLCLVSIMHVSHHYNDVIMMMLIIKYRIADNFRGEKNSFNSKTVIVMSKN